MEGHCSTGQSPQRAVVPMEEEEEEEEEEEVFLPGVIPPKTSAFLFNQICNIRQRNIIAIPLEQELS